MDHFLDPARPHGESQNTFSSHEVALVQLLEVRGDIRCVGVVSCHQSRTQPIMGVLLDLDTFLEARDAKMFISRKRKRTYAHDVQFLGGQRKNIAGCPASFLRARKVGIRF